VETFFYGSKCGIEPYAIQVSPDGELFVLDFAKNNILRVTPPLSRCMCVHLKLCLLILFQK
jgi:streptogramin lyase